MKKLFIVLFLLLTTSLFAGGSNFYKYDKYFKKYGKKYGIPAIVLKTVALTENVRLNPRLIGKNTNGTLDLGLMQINTIQIKELKKFHLTKKKLLRPEVNIEVAAYMLSRIIKRKGYSWWSIGNYHSATPKYKRKWLRRAKGHIRRLKRLRVALR